MKAIIEYQNQILDGLPQFRLNDYGMDIKFYIQDASGSIFNLTSCAVTFVAKRIDGNIVDKYLINSAGVIITATSGTCKYTIKNTDLDEVGSFDCYLKITKTGVEYKIPLGYLDVFNK